MNRSRNTEYREPGINKKCDQPYCFKHGKVNLRVAAVGGIFILNSALANWIFYVDNPIAGSVSAVLGALILTTPIMIAAVREMKKGRFYMNGLVALALLAGFAAEKYQEVGIIALFMLVAIAIEEKTAIGAKASIEELIRLTPDRDHIVDPETGTDA